MSAIYSVRYVVLYVHDEQNRTYEVGAILSHPRQIDYVRSAEGEYLDEDEVRAQFAADGRDFDADIDQAAGALEAESIAEAKAEGWVTR